MLTAADLVGVDRVELYVAGRFVVYERKAPAAPSAKDWDRLRKQADARRARWLDTTVPIVKRFFDRQKTATLAKLRGEKTRRHTRHYVPKDGRPPQVSKVIAVDDLYDVDKWEEEFEADLHDTTFDLAREAAIDAGDDLLVDPYDTDNADAEGGDAEGGFDRKLEEVVAAVLATAALSVGTTRDLIAAALQRGEDEDLPLDRIADQVKQVFDSAVSYRAEDIGTGVVVGAEGGAVHAVAQMAGNQQKGWLTMQDDRVRDSHEEIDVEATDLWVDVDEPFDVGGEELMYPRDPAGSPEQTANCRCLLVFRPDPAAAAAPADEGDLVEAAANVALQLKEWDEADHPRGPDGRFGSGSSDGRVGLPTANFTDPATGQPMTRTKIGALGESLFEKTAGPDLADKYGAPLRHLSEGANRNAPLDYAGDHQTGIEVKTISSTTENQKTAISAEEKDRKLAEADRLGLKGTATVLQVVDMAKGTMTVYHAEGIVSRSASKMDLLGTYNIAEHLPK